MCQFFVGLGSALEFCPRELAGEPCLVAENGLFDWTIPGLDAFGKQQVMDEDEGKIPGRNLLFLLEQLRRVDHLAQNLLVCRSTCITLSALHDVQRAIPAHI